MNTRHTQHTTFVITHNFDFSPSTVFDAWISAEAKAQWFVGPDKWRQQVREVDFRVGGRERGADILIDQLATALQRKH